MTEIIPVPRLKPTTVVINQAWCKKCGICITFCAKGVLVFGENKVETARQDDCVGCGICENLCPDYAITLEVEGQ